MEKDNVKRAVNTLIHDSGGVTSLVGGNLLIALRALENGNLEEAKEYLLKAKETNKKMNDVIDYFYVTYKNDFESK